MSTHKNLSWKTKIGYALGDFGMQCSFTLVSTYLTVYYSDALGLAPIIISTIMLIARVWDAVNDPMFGVIAENTHTRWGRFRPYILLGAPLLCLFNCLTFLDLELPAPWKVFWAAFTYICCGMANTAVGISLSCLANSITAVNKERVSLNAIRSVFGAVIMTGINAINMPAILYFGNGQVSSPKGYFIVSVILSIIALPCLWICFFSTKETVAVNISDYRQTISSAMKNLVRSFSNALQDHDTKYLILALIVFLTGLYGRIGIMSYYFIYILDSPLAISLFTTAWSIGMLLVNFYAPLALNHIDKKYVGALGCVIQMACCIVFYIQGEAGVGNIGIIIGGFIFGLTNTVSLTSFTLGAEIIDDLWLRTGIRSDGLIMSCITFSSKLGSAIGGSIGILVLSAVGFAANTEMSAETLSKMNAVINLAPVAFFLVSAVLLLQIRMTNRKAVDNEQKLKEKGVVASQ